MANDPKLKKGFAQGAPPNNINDVETQADTGAVGSPPNVNPADNTAYEVGQPPQPPSVTSAASAAKPRRPKTSQIGSGTSGSMETSRFRIVLKNGNVAFAETEEEAINIARESYGPNFQTHKVIEVIRLEPEAAPEPANQIAQRTQTRTRVEKVEDENKYPPEDQKRVDLFNRVSRALPDEPVVQQLAAEAVGQAENNRQTQTGPIPKENLGTVAQMYGQLKKYIYEGYAEFYHDQVNQRSLKTPKNKELYYTALQSQQAQIYALRYGMSTLTDLHRGLDLASWNFFFNSLGPFGELLEKLHHKEIAFNMAYYGGRSFLSPRYLDYIIKDLPEEKAVDIIYNSTTNLFHILGKYTPVKIFSKPVDEYGRVVNDAPPVFTPILKFQNKVINTTKKLNELGTEKSLIALEEKIDNLNKQIERVTKGLPNFNDKQRQAALEQLGELRSVAYTQFLKEENKYKKRWFFGLLGPDKLSGKETLDTLRAKVFRTIMPKKVLRKIKTPESDFLSWIFGIVGQWVFEVTIGNAVRFIMEKITGTEAWVKLTKAIEGAIERNSLLRTTRLTFSTAQDFIKAGPSLNTLSGGYLGYTVGGEIGKAVANALGIDPVFGQTIGSTVGLSVGGGFGWGYQWVLNMGKNQMIMNWVENYKINQGLIDELNDKLWSHIKEGGKFTDKEVLQYKQEIQQLLEHRATNLSNILGKPGALQRLAYWLEKSPWGKLVRIPLNGFAVSSLIEQMRAAGLVVPDWYQPWMPVMGNYLWQIRGSLFQGFNFLTGRFVGFSYKMMAFDLKTVDTVKILDSTFADWSSEMSGRGFKIIRFEVRTLPNGTIERTIEYGKFNSLFTRLEGYYSKILSSGPARWFQGLSQRFAGVAVKNIFNPGFFIGLELASMLGLPFWSYPLAAIGGSLGYSAISWGLWKFAGNYWPKLLGSTTFSAFLSRASLGGFLGWGVGTIIEWTTGIPGAGLYGTIIGSLVFAFGPLLLQVFAPGLAASLSAMAGVAGAFTTSLLAGLGIELSFVSLAVPVAVASVALLAIFAIVIVGSAWWIPISENLQGITATSRCFSINQPTLNNTVLPVFKNGDKKDICWETTVAEEYYPEGITKTKTLSPFNKFTVGGKTVSIQLPGQQYFDLPKNEYSYKVEDIVQGNPAANQVSGMQYKFTISLPKLPFNEAKQKTLESLNNYANQIKNGANSPAEYQKTSELLVAKLRIQKAVGEFQKETLLNEEVSFLKNITAKTPEEIEKLSVEKREELIKKINVYKNSPAINFIGSAQISDPETIRIIASCKNSTAQECLEINSALTPYDQTIADANQFFDSVGQLSPQQISEKITQINNNINNINNQTGSVDGEIKNIKDVTNILKTYGDSPEDYKNAMEKLAGDQANNLNLFKIPAGSKIKVCLKDVVYTGEESEQASVTESDSANLPYVPQFGSYSPTVPYCQASLTTNLNQVPPGQMATPVGPNCQITQNYDHGNHDGIDLVSSGGLGSPIYSATPGKVVAKGYEGNGFGNYLIIEDGNGYFYMYGHLGSSTDDNIPAFAKGIGIGTTINAGQEIGYLGDTGRVTGPHLHFAISTSGNVSDFWNRSSSPTINPIDYLPGCN